MKKTFTAFMALTLTASALAGCSNTATQTTTAAAANTTAAESAAPAETKAAGEEEAPAPAVPTALRFFPILRTTPSRRL